MHIPVASPQLPSDLQGAVDLACTHYRLPAVAGALVTSDSIEVAVSGVQRRGGEEATTDDLWHLGSNTKAITATLCTLLAESGELDWAAIPEQRWGLDTPQDCTLLELVNHRGGIAPFTAGGDFARLPDFGPPGREQSRAFARYALLNKSPTSARGQFLYSNAGYAVVGALVEDAGDADFLDVLRARLLEPLGLRGEQGWPALLGEQPWGHTVSWWRLRPHSPQDTYRLEHYMLPAGDLSMTAGDYARFVQLHLRGLRGLAPAAEMPQLSAESIAELHSRVEYSGGWMRTHLDGVDSHAHEGSAGTFHCITVIQPQRDRAVFVVANAGGTTAGNAVRETAMALLKDGHPK